MSAVSLYAVSLLLLLETCHCFIQVQCTHCARILAPKLVTVAISPLQYEPIFSPSANPGAATSVVM